MNGMASPEHSLPPPRALGTALSAVKNITRRAIGSRKLLDVALEAHGGIGRWDRYSEIVAQFRIRGVLWVMKQNPGILGQFSVTTPTRYACMTMAPFVSAGWRATFKSERVTIIDSDNAMVEAIDDPVSSFDGHGPDTPWHDLHVAYFTGVALWAHLTGPFLFTLPGVRVEEIAPWREDGEIWRRLSVDLPIDVAGHSRATTAYFGPDGLMRRRDHTLDVLGGVPTATYLSEYRSFDGIQIATRARTLPISADGKAIPSPLLVSLDMWDAEFL